MRKKAVTAFLLSLALVLAPVSEQLSITAAAAEADAVSETGAADEKSGVQESAAEETGAVTENIPEASEAEETGAEEEAVSEPAPAAEEADNVYTPEGSPFSYTYEIDENGAVITGYKNNADSTYVEGDDIVLPSEINGMPVYKIGNQAFLQAGIRFSGKLVIPDSVMEIGVQAFGQGHFEKGIQFSSNLKKIDAHAFLYATIYGGMELPDSLEEIGESAFYGIYGDSKNFKLPSGLKKIGGGAFNEDAGPSRDGDRWMGELVIPEGVTEIGSCAFFGCGALSKDIYIPGSVQEIGMNAFFRWSCQNAEITIHAPKGSYAETYALEHGYSFAATDEESSGDDSNEGNSGSSGENDENVEDMAAVTTSTGAVITSALPIQNGVWFHTAVTTPFSSIMASEKLAEGETLVACFSETSASAADQKAVADAAASKGAQVVYLFDLSMFVAGRDAEDNSVKKLAAALTFVISAPANIDWNAYDFAVVRVHDGKASILYDQDSDPATITFATDRFSTYAVIYAEKGKLTHTSAQKDSVPRTGDRIPAAVPAGLAVSFLSLACAAALMRRRRG